ncbi:RNA polymerase sigma factor [Bernardetia sp. ABR2-2B]|uniref:RNA polymerase sigma factor n=1 Tax=Bernardetia sp. ABR2-2B TaxID=3127472 RepID=UPI0030D46B1E
MKTKKLTFEEQVIALQPKLERYCLKFTKDKNKAEDILQEVFYKAFKYKKNFKVGTNLSAWLHRIARNTFLDSKRANKTQRNTSYVEAIDEYLLRNTAKNKAIEQISLEVIWNVIEQVQESHKTPFIMVFRGYTCKEIADILHIPVGTVKNRVFKAREAIKKQLISLGYKKQIVLLYPSIDEIWLKQNNIK